MKIRHVGADELGRCPASVDMLTGVIDKNRDVLKKYTAFEWEFIINHEKGHYKLQTDSESEADRYALRQMCGKGKRSLKRSLDLLWKMRIIDEKRFTDLYLEALKIDAQRNGNELAKNEIKHILKLENMLPKIRTNSVFMPLNGGDDFLTSIKEKFPIRDKSERLSRGFELSGNFISFETAVLVFIALLLIFKLK